MSSCGAGWPPADVGLATTGQRPVYRQGHPTEALTRLLMPANRELPATTGDRKPCSIA